MYGRVSIIVVLIIFLIVPVRVSADIKKDCRRETRVSWDALRRLKAGDFNQNDSKLKCYLKCFMTKMGILTKNVEIDVQRALRHLPRSLHESSMVLLNECKSVSGEDPCDKAFQIVKCYVKSHPEILNNAAFV